MPLAHGEAEGLKWVPRKTAAVLATLYESSGSSLGFDWRCLAFYSGLSVILHN